jgi:ParB family transcriptional regulator, chromosome partitioning protein
MAPPPSSARRAAAGAGRVRGLLADRARDALFDLAAGGPRLVEADVDRIEPHPDQPRRRVDEAGLAELAASIERHGLLQPVVVREAPGGDPGRYVLVAGQRRLLAHRRLGRERVAALVVAGDADELALVENLQRQDLAPLEEAEAVAALKARHGYGLDELARVLGKARSTVSELLSLDRLPEAVKAEVRAAEPPAAKSVLVELARLGGGDPDRQLALWRRLRAGGGATVRAARAAKGSAAEGSDVRTPDGPVRTSELLAAGRRLLGGIERLDAAAVRVEPELAALLAALRERLDRLAAGG